MSAPAIVPQAVLDGIERQRDATCADGSGPAVSGLAGQGVETLWRYMRAHRRNHGHAGGCK
jgi:hypothetical protein